MDMYDLRVLQELSVSVISLINMDFKASVVKALARLCLGVKHLALRIFYSSILKVNQKRRSFSFAAQINK